MNARSTLPVHMRRTSLIFGAYCCLETPAKSAAEYPHQLHKKPKILGLNSSPVAIFILLLNPLLSKNGSEIQGFRIIWGNLDFDRILRTCQIKQLCLPETVFRFFLESNVLNHYLLFSSMEVLQGPEPPRQSGKKSLHR